MPLDRRQDLRGVDCLRRIFPIDGSPYQSGSADPAWKKSVGQVVQEQVSKPPLVSGGTDVLVEKEKPAGPQRAGYQAKEVVQSVEVVQGLLKEHPVESGLLLQPIPRIAAVVGDAAEAAIAGVAGRFLDTGRTGVNSDDAAHQAEADRAALEVPDPAADARGPLEWDPFAQPGCEPGGRPDIGIARDSKVDASADERVTEPDLVEIGVMVESVPVAGSGS